MKFFHVRVGPSENPKLSLKISSPQVCGDRRDFSRLLKSRETRGKQKKDEKSVPMFNLKGRHRGLAI